MNAEDLRKLAEIAGFSGTIVSTFRNEDGAEVPIEVYLKDGKESIPVVLWQPHLRIEQAYSVENGIPEEKRREYIYQLIIATGQQGLPPTYKRLELSTCNSRSTLPRRAGCVEGGVGNANP